MAFKVYKGDLISILLGVKYVYIVRKFCSIKIGGERYFWVLLNLFPGFFLPCAESVSQLLMDQQKDINLKFGHKKVCNGG